RHAVPARVRAPQRRLASIGPVLRGCVIIFTPLDRGWFAHPFANDRYWSRLGIGERRARLRSLRWRVSRGSLGHVADDGLPPFIPRPMLHGDGLLAATSGALERLHLNRESSSKFVQGAFSAVLFLRGLCVGKPLSLCHGRHVNCGKLCGKHCLQLISRIDV